jgi:hypothetical protein
MKLCLRAVERPSENMMPLIESPYAQSDGALTGKDAAKCLALIHSMTGPGDVPGRDYGVYRDATFTTVFMILRALDDSNKWFMSFARLNTPEEWRSWIMGNSARMRRLEAEPRYRTVVTRAQAALGRAE